MCCARSNLRQINQLPQAWGLLLPAHSGEPLQQWQLSNAPQHADDLTLLQEGLVVLRADNPGKFKGWLALDMEALGDKRIGTKPSITTSKIRRLLQAALVQAEQGADAEQRCKSALSMVST